MSYFDDKKYVLDDRIRTLAHFHKDSVTSCKDIEKDSDKKDWKGLWCLKKIVIENISACNKIDFSSNVNEVIRAVLNFLFFYKKISHVPKAQKAPKAQKRDQAKA